MRFVVKLRHERVAELTADGTGEPFARTAAFFASGRVPDPDPRGEQLLAEAGNFASPAEVEAVGYDEASPAGFASCSRT
jgi:hypothetical protein